MTVIVAVPVKGGVVMAADSKLMRRYSVIGEVPKIVRKAFADGTAGGPVALLGVAGSHALASVARHSLGLPARPDVSDDASCDGWAYAVAVALAELATEAKPPLLVDDGYVDGEALLAYGPRLWLLSGQNAVPITGPFAIGSGAEAARGALYASAEFGMVGNYPHDAMRLAVRAAGALDAMCGGEIQIETTGVVEG